MFHVDLAPDHPGFHDRSYRERRDTIARIAASHAGDGPCPDAPYTPAEHAVWRAVTTALAPLHGRFAARDVQAMLERFPLPTGHIPQLAPISSRLRASSGFRLRPVAGLIPAREFLAALAADTFLATQYIRHASRPWYTPEPDVIHELVGHAATLADPRLAALSRCFGRAALRAGEAELAAIERVYWFTLEFGLVREDGEVRAVGAGLLSSVEEIERGVTRTEHRAWDLATIAATDYSTAELQRQLFVAPSLADMVDETSAWLEQIGR
jgi:phenylalanine-4-hydroxylase